MSTIKKKIYISLPMTGRSNDDIVKDCTKAKMLLSANDVEVITPLEVSSNKDLTYEQHMGNDIAALLTCNIIAMLPGWQHSKGCRLEKAAAEIYGLDIIEPFFF